MRVAREMIFKEVIRDVAMQKFYLIVMDLDGGDLLPVFGGLGEGVISDRAGHRPGRQDRT